MLDQLKIHPLPTHTVEIIMPYLFLSIIHTTNRSLATGLKIAAITPVLDNTVPSNFRSISNLSLSIRSIRKGTHLSHLDKPDLPTIWVWFSSSPQYRYSFLRVVNDLWFWCPHPSAPLIWVQLLILTAIQYSLSSTCYQQILFPVVYLKVQFSVHFCF